MNKALAIQAKNAIRNASLSFSLVIAVALFASSSLASSDETPNPYSLADETWVTISGTVRHVGLDTFTLNYGEGNIVVEVDDGDRDGDAYELLLGDAITVSGRIGGDFFETKTIEAGAVYVKKIGTTFFASSSDEESWSALAGVVVLTIPKSHMLVQGKVTQVGHDEFVLDTGVRELVIDTGLLPYNPLDDEGYQQIKVGDWVRVTGVIDQHLIVGHEIDAVSIIELYPHRPTN